MKIIDGFTFYNELDLLEMRFEELYEVVDKFILVEATTTHIGNPKELFFYNNKDRYAKYSDKIVHVIVDDMPKSDNPWVPEKFQRNAINRGLSSIELSDTDLITICDVDEIPDAKTLKYLKENQPQKAVSLLMDFYTYNFNCKRKSKWGHPKVVPFSLFKNIPNPEYMRHLRCECIENGGWHLSNFGSIDFIRNKLSNYAHQEFNNDNYNNEEVIKKRIESCSDLFGRKDEEYNFVKIEDNDYLPKNYKMLHERII